MYNPKHKATLPYYDLFPLVLPIQKLSDGFIGINFHYLYPKDRAILLDEVNVHKYLLYFRLDSFTHILLINFTFSLWISPN